MAILFRIILLFLIIFNFKVPLVYNSTVLAAILATLYYVFIRGSVSLEYFYRQYNFRILAGLVCLIILCFSFPVLLGTYDFVLMKCFVLQLFMISTLIYILPILIEGNEDNMFAYISQIVCLAFALQGLIQVSAFFIHPLGDFMISIKPAGVQKMLLGPHEIYFRGFALTGSPFFELPGGFGLSFILFFRLLLNKNNQYISGYKAYIIFSLLLAGSLLSGRTAFVGLLMGLSMFYFLTQNKLELIFKTATKMIIPLMIILGGYNFVLTSSQRYAIENHVFPFAFEFYYNYKNTGTFSTSSTDIMMYKQYFMPSTKTLIHGDGRYADLDGGGYYMHTDAGYMRAILYGGIFFWLGCLFYQLQFFIQPLSSAWIRRRNLEDYYDFWCFMIMFLHLFLLEIKAEAVGRMNIMQVLLCLIGTSYMVRYKFKEGDSPTLPKINYTENEDSVFAARRAF